MQNWMCELEKSTFLKEDPTSSRLLALLEENCRGKPRSFPTCQPGLLLALVLLKSAQFQDFSEGKFSFFFFLSIIHFLFFHFKKYLFIYFVWMHVCVVWGRGAHARQSPEEEVSPLSFSVYAYVHLNTSQRPTVEPSI